MGRPASSDYWRRWRAEHPGVPGAGTRASSGAASGRLPLAEDAIAAGRRRARPGRYPSPARLGAGARRPPRPRGPPRPPLRRALPRRRQRAPAGSPRAAGPGGDEPPPGFARSAPGATTSRRCSRSAERWMARSRVCACRGCEAHTGACGWPTTNERRCDRCGRPGFANRFRRTPDHPVRRTVSLATAGEADGRGLGRAPRLDLPGLASRAACGPTRRARSRPSRAARPRWRAAAGSARRALRELQRAEGAESAATVSLRYAHCGDIRPGEYRHRDHASRTRRGATRASRPGPQARAGSRHLALDPSVGARRAGPERSERAPSARRPRDPARWCSARWPTYWSAVAPALREGHRRR